MSKNERFLDDRLWQRIDDLREYVGLDSHHYQTVDDLVAEVDRLEGEILRQRKYIAPIERLVLSLSSGSIFIPTPLNERLDFIVRHINVALRPGLEYEGKLHSELEDELREQKSKVGILRSILMKMGPPRFKTTFAGKGRWRCYGTFLEVTPEEHAALLELENDLMRDEDI
jgi:hypothetical protein